VSLVIKLGGGALERGAGLDAIAGDIAALVDAGEQLLVVHGGGAQTSALQRSLGQEPRRVGGRRITDEATLGALLMAVGGKLNVELCAALLAAGARPVGLHGASALAVEAERRPPRVYSGAGDEPVDLGHVGDVVGFNRELLQRLLDGGYTPVLACIGASRGGALFNINADVVANALAVAVEASALVLVSDIVGVLRERDDPASRIRQLDRREANDAIARGVVTEGMIPKLEESFAAIEAGVGRVHVCGRLAAGELREALRTPGSVGTVLVASAP
jgi:acetylglutamate kinase